MNEQVNIEAPKVASLSVVAQHAATLASLPFSDTRDFDDASRGFMGSRENATVVADNGRVVWSLEQHNFLVGNPAPTTVNPSLWRQSQLNMHSWAVRSCTRRLSVARVRYRQHDIDRR
jgi:alkyl sulfatase BDS1-like metallo-beta-lactamase superfamily hydrolase